MRHETVLRLIDRIYDAATDVNAWPVFLTELSGALGATAAGLLQHELRPGALRGMVTASTAVDPESAALYGQRYGALDPWGIALVRQKQLDKNYLVTAESLVPFAELQRTEYYNDFTRRFDYVRNVGMGIKTGPGIATTVTVLRGGRMPPFGAAELRVMAALQLHVGRALSVHNRLHDALRHSAGLEAALDRLQIGVVLLTRSGRVVFANHAARSLAAARDGFRLDADGPAASHSGECRELRRLLVDAGQGHAKDGGIVRISRPSRKAPLVALVSPLTSPMALGERLVALFISDPDVGPD